MYIFIFDGLLFDLPGWFAIVIPFAGFAFGVLDGLLHVDLSRRGWVS